VSGTTVLARGDFDPALVAAVTRATEAAARAAGAWSGRGDKDAADGAAVAAMRAALVNAPFDGTVVIGEGEKDAAPMLANGERLGAGNSPRCDVAVDPLDGTRLTAEGLPGSISVIALAPADTMFDPLDVFYMDKIVAGPVGIGVLDLRRSATQNLEAYAIAAGIPVGELVVVVLDKPRHESLIAEIRAARATVRLVGEGDVLAAVAAASAGSDVDLVLGIGGTPEGIVAACAVRALGGFMQGRLAPQSDEQLAMAIAAGHDTNRILELDDLVASDRVLFVSTAVT
jgi:fructose-1,6-bisphosphatase II